MSWAIGIGAGIIGGAGAGMLFAANRARQNRDFPGGTAGGAAAGLAGGAIGAAGVSAIADRYCRLAEEQISLTNEKQSAKRRRAV